MKHYLLTFGLLALLSIAVDAQPAFPLKNSSNNRYLVDQRGVRFPSLVL